MSWVASLKTVGAVVLSTIYFVARLLYLISTPLRWPLYYLYASIIFLLSPIWAICNLGLGAASFIVSVIIKFKYLYVYLACAAIIGICAGFMLHGTSSFIFVLLGMNTTTDQRGMVREQRQKPTYPSRRPLGIDEDDAYDMGSSSNASGRRSDRRQHIAGIGSSNLLEKRAKLLRSRGQPVSRRRGLLEQTIHEESSESDYF